MESHLDTLNTALDSSLSKFRTDFQDELNAVHTVAREPAELAPRSEALDRVVNQLNELQTLLAPPLHNLVDGIFAYTISKALLSAVENNIPDILAAAGGRLTMRDLCARTGLAPEPTSTLLSLLASTGIFSLSPAPQDLDTTIDASASALGTTFANGAVKDRYDASTLVVANTSSSALLINSDWTQWHLWPRLYSGPFYELARHLPASLPMLQPRSAMQLAYTPPLPASSTTIANEPAAELGPEPEPLYKLLTRIPWAPDLHRAMGVAATAQAPGMLADYPLWSEVADATVCDLGGGNGQFLAELLRHFPAMRGAILETESMACIVRGAYFGERYRRRCCGGDGSDEEWDQEQEHGEVPFSDVADRLQSVHTGDFFVEVPPYHVYTIRWTLHNWGDDDAVRILVNVKAGLLVAEEQQQQEQPQENIMVAVEPRLLVIEAVAGLSRLDRPAMYGSLVMWLGSKGRERTVQEWQALAENAGWRIYGVWKLRGCIPCMIDLRPV